MTQNISKAQIGYVLLGLSSVLYLAIAYLFFLIGRDGSPSFAVPLGLLPIAILNSVLGANLIAKPKP